MAFISIGLIIASFMTQFEGFNVIVNFFVMPLFFLSGAMTPISNFPIIIQYISYLSPLTYGIDIMRYALLGEAIMPISLSLLALSLFTGALVFLAAYFFEKSEI